VKPNTVHFYFPPLQIWSDVAFKTAQMMLASAFVVGHRTSRMIQAGPLPDANDRRELTLMGREKIFAGAEAVQAMALGVIKLNQQLGILAIKQMMTGGWGALSLASSWTAAQYAGRQARFVHDAVSNGAVAASQLSHSTARIITRGIKPVHARVKKNVKRLAKR
jgi:hypothetical protein